MSEEKYHLSVDGGGTKLISILYDSGFQCRAVGVSGAVNALFETEETVRANMVSSIEQCLGGRTIPIETLWGTMPGPFHIYVEELRKRTSVGCVVNCNEGKACLLAGVQRTEGLVALSGTGSGVFYIKEEDAPLLHYGGWGSHLGDDGSGYEIGRAGYRLAFDALERVGGSPLLARYLSDDMGISDKNSAIAYLYQDSATRGRIAAFCRQVGKAAAAGDELSKAALRHAGAVMAKQILTLAKRENVPDGMVVIPAGGAWKSGGEMIRSFQAVLQRARPRLLFKMPAFDPVVGGIAQTMLESGLGRDECRERLNRGFPAFIWGG